MNYLWILSEAASAMIGLEKMNDKECNLHKHVLSQWFETRFAPVTLWLQSKYECLPSDTPPGSARDGEADARVLVRQPVCPAHRSEGQENRVSAVGHQGGERLDWGPLQKSVRCAGPGPGEAAAQLCLLDWGRPLQDTVTLLTPLRADRECLRCLSAERCDMYLWLLCAQGRGVTGRLQKEPYDDSMCNMYTVIILLPHTFKCPRL